MNDLIVKGASYIGVSRAFRIGNDGHVKRKIVIRDGDGRTLAEIVVLSRDGILPVHIAEEAK